jgi:hypothetical protein
MSLDGVVVLNVRIGDSCFGQRHTAQAALRKRHLKNPVNYEGDGDPGMLSQRCQRDRFLPYVEAHSPSAFLQSRFSVPPP